MLFQGLGTYVAIPTSLKYVENQNHPKTKSGFERGKKNKSKIKASTWSMHFRANIALTQGQTLC
jgi:hypothetical protein